ncbi:NEDD8-like [Toxotes jaculatrix]|uniref:NEDD8-like n=1 Tax=Toxotes jaculatrix TaxID=941984 RepID=UPI001B3A917E|nr:NEDD8-like [Toxotes jaculatrix]
MGKIYQVMVHGFRGEKMVVDLCNTEEQMKSMTVLQLKEKIAKKLPEGAGVEVIRLIFVDKELDEDTKLLSEYGIQHMSVIHMVVRVPGGLSAGQRPSAAPSAAAAAAAAASRSS